MTAAQAIARLRRAKDKGAPSWEVGSGPVSTLRGWGHEISFDGQKGRAGYYRLVKDACVCTRVNDDGKVCGEISVKPRIPFMCDFCAIELGLMEEPTLEPHSELHCGNGHPKTLGNVSKDGRCLTCQKQHQTNRQQKRKLERAKAAA